MRKRTTWILLANGSRALIVLRREGGSRFDVISEMSSEESHIPSHLLGAERPGRTQESGYTGRHAIEPREDPHAARMTAFLQSVAELVNERGAAKAFDRLILFAPPHALGELRGNARRRNAGEDHR